MEQRLPPINASFYKDTNLDPQQVTAKEPHRAIMYLNSDDNTLQTNKTNIVFNTVKRLGDNPQTMAEGISRFKVDSLHINYVSPNVNVYNNTITFFSTFNLGYHTVALREGFYTSTTDILDELILQLNSAGASGLTFSYTIVPGSPDKYELQSSGGMYFFKLDSPAIIRGSQLLGLPTGEIATNSKIGGSVSLFYTRYIDICSTIISKYEKIRTVSNNSIPNIIVRLYLDDNIEHKYINYYNIPNISYNFFDAEPIYSIDFQLRDEFGDLLYIPPQEFAFSWGISLILEY